MAEQTSNGLTTKKLTRSDVRKATIYAVRQAKADPRSLKLTAGQRRHISAQARRAS